MSGSGFAFCSPAPAGKAKKQDLPLSVRNSQPHPEIRTAYVNHKWQSHPVRLTFPNHQNLS